MSVYIESAVCNDIISCEFCGNSFTDYLRCNCWNEQIDRMKKGKYCCPSSAIIEDSSSSSCGGDYLSADEEEDDLIQCGNCGNRWDGYAQCNCWGREMLYASDEEADPSDEEADAIDEADPSDEADASEAEAQDANTAHIEQLLTRPAPLLPPPQREPPYPTMIKDQINENTNTLKKLNTTVTILKEVVSQLLDGLYNPTTQNHSRDWMREMLYEIPQTLTGDDLHFELQKIMHEDNCPTTRQGDENAIKIQALERKCEALERRNLDLEKIIKKIV